MRVYACSYNRTRGKAVCANGLRRPIDEVNGAVVGWLKHNVLAEGVVTEVIKEIRRRLFERGVHTEEKVAKLEEEAQQLKDEIANLIAAVAAIGGLSASHRQPSGT